MTDIRILGVSGSLRKASYNTALLRAAAQALPAGFALEVYAGLGEIPHYNEDLDVDPAPEPVARLRQAIADADGILIATPEFNGAMPGVLKDAIDWASRPFPDNCLKGRPIAVIGASVTMFGAVWAQGVTRKALELAGADVLTDELPVCEVHTVLAEAGTLTGPELQTRLEDLVASFAARLETGRTFSR
jgi:chromate reductase